MARHHGFLYAPCVTAFCYFFLINIWFFCVWTASQPHAKLAERKQGCALHFSPFLRLEVAYQDVYINPKPGETDSYRYDRCLPMLHCLPPNITLLGYHTIQKCQWDRKRLAQESSSFHVKGPRSACCSISFLFLYECRYMIRSGGSSPVTWASSIRLRSWDPEK